jgi:hypothetical protein
MSGWEHAGWILAASLIVNLIMFWLGRRTGKGDCKSCGITELKTEISRLCNLVRALAEKAGMTVKEQLEIESIER